MNINWLSIQVKIPILRRKFRYVVVTENYIIKNLSLQEANYYAKHFVDNKEYVLIRKPHKRQLNGIDIIKEFSNVESSVK